MNKIVAWLIYDKKGAVRNQSYIKMHEEEGKKLGIHVILKYAEDFTFGIHQGQLLVLYQNKKEQLPDFVICRTIYPFLSKCLEKAGIMVFNNSKVAEICNDKAKTYAYLAGKGIPLIESIFLTNQEFVQNIEEVPIQSVIKAVDGHGGEQVFLKDSYEQNEKIIKGIGRSNVIIQKLTGSLSKDVRVYIMGNKIIAAVCRTAKTGFKSNYSLGGDISLYSLNNEEEQLVYRIVKEFDFDLVGIDFLIGDDGNFILNEIEDVVGARMLYKCMDINLVGEYLGYILNKIH